MQSSLYSLSAPSEMLLQQQQRHCRRQQPAKARVLTLPLLRVPPSRPTHVVNSVSLSVPSVVKEIEEEKELLALPPMESAGKYATQQTKHCLRCTQVYDAPTQHRFE